MQVEMGSFVGMILIFGAIFFVMALFLVASLVLKRRGMPHTEPELARDIIEKVQEVQQEEQLKRALEKKKQAIMADEQQHLARETHAAAAGDRKTAAAAGIIDAEDLAKEEEIAKVEEDLTKKEIKSTKDILHDIGKIEKMEKEEAEFEEERGETSFKGDEFVDTLEELRGVEERKLDDEKDVYKDEKWEIKTVKDEIEEGKEVVKDELKGDEKEAGRDLRKEVDLEEKKIGKMEGGSDAFWDMTEAVKEESGIVGELSVENSVVVKPDKVVVGDSVRKEEKKIKGKLIYKNKVFSDEEYKEIREKVKRGEPLEDTELQNTVDLKLRMEALKKGEPYESAYGDRGKASGSKKDDAEFDQSLKDVDGLITAKEAGDLSKAGKHDDADRLKEKLPKDMEDRGEWQRMMGDFDKIQQAKRLREAGKDDEADEVTSGIEGYVKEDRGKHGTIKNSVIRDVKDEEE